MNVLQGVRSQNNLIKVLSIPLDHKTNEVSVMLADRTESSLLCSYCHFILSVYFTLDSLSCYTYSVATWHCACLTELSWI